MIYSYSFKTGILSLIFLSRVARVSNEIFDKSYKKHTNTFNYQQKNTFNYQRKMEIEHLANFPVILDPRNSNEFQIRNLTFQYFSKNIFIICQVSA